MVGRSSNALMEIRYSFFGLLQALQMGVGVAKVIWPKSFDTAFDSYEVTAASLGEGGAGRVFPVKNGAGKTFALKCLAPDRISSDRKKRFKNEIAFCSDYEHENIIRVLDVGVVDIGGTKCPFYVMDEFPSTLRKLMDKGLDTASALRLFALILSGMDASHKYGVIHRDLKPENILCNETGDKLVIADFGIAHFEEDMLFTKVETAANSRLANYVYAAPEQKMKGAPVGSSADVYALGLILHELLMGIVPVGSGIKSIASKYLDLGHLDVLVDLMIRNDPMLRPANADAVIREMHQRGNLQAAIQRVDVISRKVVPAFSPLKPEPIEIMDTDWDEGELKLTFNKHPPQQWIERFGHPTSGGWQSVMGAGPEQFRFYHQTAVVNANENSAADIANFAKGYVRMANDGYERDLQVAAERQQRDYQQKMEKERMAAEARARVLSKLKPQE